MRKEIVAHLDAGGADLIPEARHALEELKKGLITPALPQRPA
jgi:hypothetical protein